MFAREHRLFISLQKLAISPHQYVFAVKTKKRPKSPEKVDVRAFCRSTRGGACTGV